MLTMLCGRGRVLWPRVEREIGEALRAGEENILLLTPAQSTLQAELDLVDDLHLPGLLRVQVLSPESLARQVFSRTGTPEGARLDGRGRAMAMEAALRQTRQSLRYYKSAATRRGFRERAGAAIAAFKQARLMPATVRAAAAAVEGDDPSDALALKLYDLAALYETYEARLSAGFLDAEDLREALCQRLVQSGFARGARVWCYGFDLVTPQLMRLTALLACEAQSVVFALAWQGNDAPDAYVFQPARDTLNRFAHFLDVEGLLWRQEILQEESAQPLPLAYLSRSLFAPDAPPFAGESGACLRLTAAADPSDEAARIAAALRALAREGLPLEQAAVVFGDGADCAGPLSRALERAGIPFHVDAKRPALSHPLPRALLLAVQCACEGFAADDMADLLKSGLAGVERDAAQALENRARSRGLRGAQWEKPDEDPDAERARQTLVEPLLRLQAALRDARTASESVGAVYRWLEDARVYETLERWEAAFAVRGMHEEAADIAQAWRIAMETLDQLCALQCGARLPMKDAPRLLEAGLQAAELGALPELPGAVHCGQLGHVKLGARVKALFLMGMQDGVLRPAESGLFSDDEAERAARAADANAFGLRGDALSCLRQMNLLDMTGAPCESLAVSYSLCASDGSPRQPAAWLKMLRRLFPTLSEGDGKRRVDAWYAQGPALDALGPALRAAMTAGEIPPDVRDATLCLLQNEKTAVPARRVLDALRPSAESAPLRRDTVRSLYRFTTLSATRLETFARCPYRHFVQFGLCPREREEFRVDRRDTGVFCHRAMERYAKLALKKDGWPRVTREESDALMDEALAPIREEWQEGPLGATAAARFEGEALCRAARRTAWAYASQMAQSDFRTVAVETRFGEGERLPPLPLMRPDGGASSLSGKIDRLDCFHAQDGSVYVRVADYKTGGAAFDFSEAAAGLQLQLPLYLAAAVRARPGARAAGALYSRFRDPIVETDSRDPEVIETQINGELKLRGVLLADPQAAAASEDRASLFNKDGSLRKNATIPGEAMDGLLCQARRLAGEMSQKIDEGEAAPRPARVGSRLACTLCDYAAICGYDPRLPDAPAREVEKLSREAALERLCRMERENGEVLP